MTARDLLLEVGPPLTALEAAGFALLVIGALVVGICLVIRRGGSCK